MNQEEQVLDYIGKHGSITPMQAFRELNITRLAAVVHSIKRHGTPLATVIHWNGQKHYAEYKKPLRGVGNPETARSEGATLPSENNMNLLGGQHMNAIKTAISLLPLMNVLYDADVIDIMPGTEPYVHITAELFRKLFPDVEPNDKNHLVTYLDGVKILAVILEG